MFPFRVERRFIQICTYETSQSFHWNRMKKHINRRALVEIIRPTHGLIEKVEIIKTFLISLVPYSVQKHRKTNVMRTMPIHTSAIANLFNMLYCGRLNHMRRTLYTAAGRVRVPLLSAYESLISDKSLEKVFEVVLCPTSNTHYTHVPTSPAIIKPNLNGKHKYDQYTILNIPTLLLMEYYLLESS